jgi:thiamine-phosphate pyrophosphorylase
VASPRHSPGPVPHLPRLHVLTTAATGPRAVAAVGRVLAAGAPLVQLRAEGADDRDLFAHARQLVTAAHAHGALCVVNDRVDVAMGAGADGVHLGARDLPVGVARALADTWHHSGGPRPLVGGTARDPETARRLVDAGADYLGVGPCYATTSKPGLPLPGGPARVAAVAGAVDVPLIAIGGVTAARVGALLDAGAHGVAVIGAVWASDDPAAAVGSLLDVLGGGW